MAKFLTTAGIGYEIEQIIKDASNQLVLVSPYLQLGKQVTDRLRDANERNVQITLFYREPKISKTDESTLENLEHLEIYMLDTLHAKCYFNESRLVVGSMNFYDYSQTRNREMGILLTVDEDPEVFTQAVKEVQSIKRAAVLRKDKQINTRIIDTHKKQTNFHLPVLSDVLQSKYPEWEYKLSTSYIWIGLPDSKIRIRVDHGLVIIFPHDTKAERFKKKTPDDLLSKKGVTQIWKGPRLIINFNKSLNDYKMTEDNQAHVVLNFLSIITTLQLYL